MTGSTNLQKQKRLIVLLPEELGGNLALARAIHQMAVQRQADVLYLALVENGEKTLGISRALATMKAVTADNLLNVSSRLVETSAWLAALRQVIQPGDIIVCHAEQTVKNGFLRVLPLEEYLPTALEAPVVTLRGWYHPNRLQTRLLFSNLLNWIVFLAIIAGFTLLEINLDAGVHGATHAILLGLLICLEFGAVLIWNNFTSR